VGFRDDRDAMLARMEALERELAQTKSNLETTEAEREVLQKERDELAEKVGDDKSAAEKEARREVQRKARAEMMSDLKTWWAGQRKARLYVFTGILLVGIAGFVAYRMLRNKPPSLSAKADKFVGSCPWVADKPLVVLDRILTKRSSGQRQYYYFYNLYDPQTGVRSLRVRLSGNRYSQEPTCLGFEKDLVWMKTRGEGLHARELATGKVVYTEKQLREKLPSAPRELGFDKDMTVAFARTKDGRLYEFATKPALGVTKLESGTKLSGSSHYKVPNGAKTYIDYRALPGRRIKVKGGERKVIELDGVQLTTQDWLRPGFVINKKYGGTLWNKPDGFIVIEPTEIGSRTYRLTRIGLDGVMHWRYTPGAKSHFSSKNRAWNATADSKTLIYFTKTAEMVGIDAKTGHHRYTVHL